MTKEEFEYHDNIDRHVISVSKDSLLLILRSCREYFTSTTAAWGFAGIGVSLVLSSILADGFKDLLSIPGETVRTVFIVLGIVMLGFSGFFTIRWFRGKTEHEPEMIIRKLVNGNESQKPLLLLSGPTVESSFSVDKKTRPKKIYQVK